MKLATEFNSYTWGKHGLNWLRNVKSAGYSALIVSDNLPANVIAKIKDLNFDVIAKHVKYNNQFDFYNTLANFTEENDYCLAIPFDFALKELEKFFVYDKVTCFKGNTPLASLVFPIVNLSKRVEASRLIEKGIQVNSLMVGANKENWSLLCKLFDFFTDSHFIDPKAMGIEQLLLNLFAVFYPERVQII